MRHNTTYTLIFAALICVVCGVLVSSAAVSLAETQQANQVLDRQKKVLEAAGLIETGESPSPDEVAKLFENIESVAVDLETGKEDPDFDLTGYNQRKAATKPESSHQAPENNSAIVRVPNRAQVFKVKNDAGEVSIYVLPIEGLGLWGTLYGYLAVDADLETVRGLTYYEHKETPGLGGEVDNPRWKALWPGRKIYGDDGDVRLEVIKGTAGSVGEAPFSFDGLSGATITGRGVSNMLQFWLGDNAYGKYFENLRAAKAA